MKQEGGELVKKYQGYIDNINSHIDNNPSGDLNPSQLKENYLRLEIYKELITDLESTTPVPAVVKGAEEVFVKAYELGYTGGEQGEYNLKECFETFKRNNLEFVNILIDENPPESGFNYDKTQRDVLKELVSDEAVEVAFNGINFGIEQPRETIKRVLRDYARGYSSGKTSNMALNELGLAVGEKLTELGYKYLIQLEINLHLQKK